MHVIEEHECTTLEEQHFTDIAVQLYNDWRWYWVDFRDDKTVLNQISYCPYCGCKLD